MEKIISDIQTHNLAFIVLISLLIGLIASILLISKPLQRNKRQSWFAILLILFILLGFPALIDLIQIGGYATLFSVILLSVFSFCILLTLFQFMKNQMPALLFTWSHRLVPLLLFCGLLTAGYLSYVEATSEFAVCGVEYSGCVTVQTSQFNQLMGFLPVAYFGLLGYFAIFFIWLFRQIGRKKFLPLAAILQWGLSFFGVLFSIYLTFLEVFVIHATCSWCVTSAVIMNSILWLSIPAASSEIESRQNEDLEDEEE